MKKLIIFFLLLISTVQLVSANEIICKLDEIKASTHFTNFQTEELLKKLYKIWDSKSEKLIELEIGSADNKKIEGTWIIYSYQSKLEIPYEQLFFEVAQNGRIKSIYYEFLDEKNELLNDQWILDKFRSNSWKIIDLPRKTHTVIPKKVLVHYEKEISAGYINGYKNNQLRFVYFGDIDEKKLDRFKWE